MTGKYGRDGARNATNEIGEWKGSCAECNKRNRGGVKRGRKGWHADSKSNNNLEEAGEGRNEEDLPAESDNNLAGGGWRDAR